MKLLLGLALVQAASGEIAAKVRDPFCVELDRVLAAAGRPDGFDRLYRARGNPPAFGFRDGCRPSGNADRSYWLCSEHLAPETLASHRLAERITACRPDAVPLATGSVRARRLRLPNAEIRIREGGGPRAQVGRTVSLIVEAKPAD